MVCPIPCIVRTNCSIIPRSPKGSSLTPTCQAAVLYIYFKLATKVPIIYYGMPNSIELLTIPPPGSLATLKIIHVQVNVFQFKSAMNKIRYAS